MRSNDKTEQEATRVVIIVAVALFAASIVLWFLFPFSSAEGHGELFWVSTPSIQGEPLLLSMSVQLNSFELETVQYHAKLFLDEEVVATKDLLLKPNESQTVDFDIPLQEKPESSVQVKITVEQTFAGKELEREPLMLIQWI
jgi:hypothetical protein